MTEPVVPAEKPIQNSTYINNPFFIAADGIKLLFTKAQSIAILLIVLSVLGLIPNFDTSQQEATNPQAFPDLNLETILLIVGISILIIAVAATVGTFISGVIAFGAARASRGETATIKQGLRATRDQFWSFLWLQVLTGLKILAWSLLFVIPGIVMAFRYSLANIAFFDKGLKGGAAIKHSLALTKGSWLTTFAGQTFFSMITFGIIAGLVETGAQAILYRQFSVTPLAERPKAHGLSIATLVIVILGAILMTALIAFLIWALINYGTSSMPEA